MQSFSLTLFKSSNCKVRSGFLFPLAFCFLSVAFYIPPHFSLPVVAQTTDARQAEGDRLFQQGLQQIQTSQLPAALNSWQQALQIYRTIKNRQREGMVLSLLGAVNGFMKNYAKAIEYTQQHLAIAREIKDRKGEGLALGNLGVVYRNLGDYAKAIEYSQQYLAIAREIKDHQGEWNALGNLGAVYRNLGNHAKAIEYIQQSAFIAYAIKDRDAEGKELGNLGATYRSVGDYAKAIEYSQSLAIAREIKDRDGEGRALRNLGATYLNLGDNPKATEYLQQSLAIFRELKNRYDEGTVLRNLGITYRLLGNYAKAIEYSQQSLAIFRELKESDEEGRALANLGIVYEFLGNYAKAIEYAQQSLAIFREINNRQGQGSALANLGITYRLLGNYAKAIEYAQQSLAIFREQKNREAEGAALMNLGLAYINLGNYAKGIEYLQQSLAIREIKDRKGQGSALGNLGIAYRLLGNYAKAIEYAQQSLVIFREINDRQQEGNALNNLGAAFLKAGNSTESEKMLVNAIQVWESIRQMLGSNDANKVSIFERQAHTYRNLQQIRVAQNNPIAALEIAERGRARAFVDLLTQRLSSGDASLVIATAPNQDQIRQIAKAQNATLVQYSIIYEEFQIQDKSQPRESALYIWVIQPTGEITFREVDLKSLWQKHNASLASLIIGNQEFLAVRSRSSLGSTKPEPNFNLRMLHQLLIDPVASLLPKDPNAHVIFIPQGSLFQVPFPALQDANDNYLIEKHTILTAPSIQVLALTRQQREKLAQKPVNTSNALVLGNPTMPSVSPSPGEPKRQLSALPGAEAEARAIAPLLKTQAITGAQGTKAAIVQKMPQASIIHLATHGLLDDVRGLGSAIALAPSGTDDGLLTAEEIFDMKLQASLVVLSACNTAEGRITGDGVIGLSRALISAGVPSVIVSLWAVPDAPTSELMQAFYQNLQSNPDKAQALRQAMLTTMKTHSNPRDWAAFTLIGEAE